MAGFPPPYGISTVQYVPQQYYNTGFIQPHLQQSINIQPFKATPEQIWVEHHSHDGRKYYYNSSTKVTTWEKPDELKSAAEKLLSCCPWKEFKSESGKIYFYNSHTKQSVWTKPKELLEAEQNALLADNSVNGASLTVLKNVDTPITPATPSDEQKPNEPSAMELAMKATLASMEEHTNEKSDTLSSVIPLPPPNADDKLNNDVKVSSDLLPIDAEDSHGTPSLGGHSPVANIPEYKTRGEMAEGLRQLFRDKEVPGNASWEHALRLIGDDPRYAVLRNFVEKKQIFNVYKTQRQKEEREEHRTQIKQSKEDLEKFLLQTKKIHSTMSYRKVDQILSSTREWTRVSDYDRRLLFRDAIQEISKREKEDARSLRRRNIKVFNEILNSMPKLTYRATWSEAQQMLLDNSRFTGDVELQSLDKQDALVCFEDHIRMLEREHDEEKEKEKRKQKRAHRKNREAFIVLLEELHSNELLTSTTLWKDLFTIIDRDERFHSMLAQRGSTPLDLFKFYVENLKSRFPMEKKLIKEILKETNTSVELTSTFDSFKDLVIADERGKNVDLGNIRLTFNSLLEKAHGRERERQREDARRLRRQEQMFCDLLRQAADPPIRTDTPWESICERFSNHPEFQAITLESERIRVFKDYIINLDSIETGAGIYTAEHDSKSSKSRRSKAHKPRSDSRDGESHSELDGPMETSLPKKRLNRHARSKSGSESPPVAHNTSDVCESNVNLKKKHKKSKSKSKKPKKYKSKHREEKSRRNFSPSSRQSGGVLGDGELEEGEAADEEFDDEHERHPEDGGVDEEGEITHRSKRHKHRQRHISTREDGEADSVSEGEVYDRQSSNTSRRKHHRS